MNNSNFKLKYNSEAAELSNSSDALDLNRFCAIKKIIDKKGKIENLLDIGCGINSLTLFLKKYCNIINYYGTDIIPDKEKIFEINGVKYFQADIDEGIPDIGVKFDCIICSEVIEHVVNPDNIFLFARKNLTHDEIFILTIPNLSVWFNRLLLCLGFQPAWTSPSTMYNVGKPFSRGEKLKPGAGGHLRLYTEKSLIQLAKAHRFKVVSTATIGSFPNFLSYINRYLKIKMLGTNYIMVLN